MTIYIIVSAILAYMIGSIPTAVWFGKYFFNIDVREHGSGNAGATNTFRVLGAKAGLTVLAIDIFKGWIATRLANIPFWMGAIPDDDIVVYKLVFGFIAVAGHIFPIYENFKGGKGVATLLGMVMAIQLNVALVCLGIFILVFSLSKYVSLGSMLAALAYPILLLTEFAPKNHPELMIGFGVVMFLLVVLTHKKNILRLINGEENKLVIKLKK